MDNTTIVGAGLAGLITACKIADAPIYEAAEQPKEQHKALLRFRDRSVSDATGIPFRQVTVRKGIVSNGTFHSNCTPCLANLYAKKVTGAIVGDRSIWNLDTVTRYIAPEDFYTRLVQRHGDRIVWGATVTAYDEGNPHRTVNTAPLPVAMRACGMDPESLGLKMEAAPIEVARYRVRGADVFQTLYFPEPALRVFRASITGDLLIVESVKAREGMVHLTESMELSRILDSFGVCRSEIDVLEKVDQRYGKIVDIPRDAREAVLFELTHRFNVFSIGRFATWRNILLDDVVKDIDVVQRLMNSSSYSKKAWLANK